VDRHVASMVHTLTPAQQALPKPSLLPCWPNCPWSLCSCVTFQPIPPVRCACPRHAPIAGWLLVGCAHGCHSAPLALSSALPALPRSRCPHHPHYPAPIAQVPMAEVKVNWTEMPGSKIRVTSMAHMALELAMVQLGYGGERGRLPPCLLGAPRQARPQAQVGSHSPWWHPHACRRGVEGAEPPGGGKAVLSQACRTKGSRARHLWLASGGRCRLHVSSLSTACWYAFRCTQALL